MTAAYAITGATGLVAGRQIARQIWLYSSRGLYRWADRPEYSPGCPVGSRRDSGRHLLRRRSDVHANGGSIAEQKSRPACLVFIPNGLAFLSGSGIVHTDDPSVCTG